MVHDADVELVRGLATRGRGGVKIGIGEQFGEAGPETRCEMPTIG